MLILRSNCFNTRISEGSHLCRTEIDPITTLAIVIGAKDMGSRLVHLIQLAVALRQYNFHTEHLPIKPVHLELRLQMLLFPIRKSAGMTSIPYQFLLLLWRFGSWYCGLFDGLCRRARRGCRGGSFDLVTRGVFHLRGWGTHHDAKGRSVASEGT